MLKSILLKIKIIIIFFYKKCIITIKDYEGKIDVLAYRGMIDNLKES